MSKRNGNSADEVFDTLRQSIVSGELRPNQRMVESAIAKQLGVSRTPAREGLKQLEMKGYLSRLPAGGLIVTDHSPSQIRNLFEIREGLETMAIKLVCQRVTEEEIKVAINHYAALLESIRNRDSDQFIASNSAFHTTLLVASGNDQLFSLIEGFRDQYFDRRITRVFTAKDWRMMITEHGQILNAVKERDALRAEKAVRRHLRTALRMALERL